MSEPARICRNYGRSVSGRDKDPGLCGDRALRQINVTALLCGRHHVCSLWNLNKNSANVKQPNA